MPDPKASNPQRTGRRPGFDARVVFQMTTELDALFPDARAPARACFPLSTNRPQTRPLSLDPRAPACDNGPIEIIAILKAVGFVHLHVHSAFSLREGALAIETLAKLAVADVMPALAITDTNNLFGALEFSEKLAKAGVQPIIGAQATVDFGDAPLASSRLAEQRVGARADRAARPDRGRLPPSDAARLRACGSTRRRATSRISRSTRLSTAEGLIALTGGPAGPIDRALGQHMADLADSPPQAPRRRLSTSGSMSSSSATGSSPRPRSSRR